MFSRVLFLTAVGFSITSEAAYYDARCVIIKGSEPVDHLAPVVIDTSNRSTSLKYIGKMDGKDLFVGVGEGHAAGPDIMGIQIKGKEVVNVSTMMNGGFAYVAYQLNQQTVSCAVNRKN